MFWLSSDPPTWTAADQAGLEPEALSLIVCQEKAALLQSVWDRFPEAAIYKTSSLSFHLSPSLVYPAQHISEIQWHSVDCIITKYPLHSYFNNRPMLWSHDFSNLNIIACKMQSFPWSGFLYSLKTQKRVVRECLHHRHVWETLTDKSLWTIIYLFCSYQREDSIITLDD